MAFDIPALSKIIARLRGDLAPPVGAGSLRRSDAEVMARAVGGATGGLYDHQGWIADQILPDKCDEDMVLRRAQQRLKVPRKAATTATGFASFTGQASAMVEAGSLYQTPDRRRVSVDVDTQINGTTSVALTAVDVGVIGNIEAGTILTAVSPVEGVSDTAVVGDDGLTGGTDQETVEQVRARLIRSYRVVPQGGSPDDFVTWALEWPGVTRAWCRRNWVGPGTVAVFFMRDGDVDPFPNAAECAAVKAYIEAVCCVTVDLYVLAPTPKPIVYRIKAVPDTLAVRAAIEAALLDLIVAEAELGTTILLTHQSEAISGAKGESDHTLVQPSANSTAAPGELLVYGGVEAWL